MRCNIKRGKHSKVNYASFITTFFYLTRKISTQKISPKQLNAYNPQKTNRHSQKLKINVVYLRNRLIYFYDTEKLFPTHCCTSNTESPFDFYLNCHKTNCKCQIEWRFICFSLQTEKFLQPERKIIAACSFSFLLFQF